MAFGEALQPKQDDTSDHYFKSELPLYKPELSVEHITAADDVRKSVEFRSTFYDHVKYSSIHQYLDTSRMYMQFANALAFGRYDAVILTGSMAAQAPVLALAAHKRAPDKVPNFTNWKTIEGGPNAIVYKTLDQKTLYNAYLNSSIAINLQLDQATVNKQLEEARQKHSLERILEDCKYPVVAIQARANITLHTLFKDLSSADIEAKLEQEFNIHDPLILKTAMRKIWKALQNTTKASQIADLCESFSDLSQIRDNIEDLIKTNNLDEMEFLEKEHRALESSENIQVPLGRTRVQLMKALHPEYLLAIRSKDREYKRIYILDNFIESGSKTIGYKAFFDAWEEAPVIDHEIMYVQEAKSLDAEKTPKYELKPVELYGQSTGMHDIVVNGKVLARAYGKGYFSDPEHTIVQGRGHDNYIDPPQLHKKDAEVPDNIWQLATNREFLELGETYEKLEKIAERRSRQYGEPDPETSRVTKLIENTRKVLDASEAVKGHISFVRSYAQYDPSNYSEYEDSVHIEEQEKQLWKESYSQLMDIIKINQIENSVPQADQKPKRMKIQTTNRAHYIIFTHLVNKLKKLYPGLKETYVEHSEATFNPGIDVIYGINQQLSPDTIKDSKSEFNTVTLPERQITISPAYFMDPLSISLYTSATQNVLDLGQEVERVRYMLDKVIESSN